MKKTPVKAAETKKAQAGKKQAKRTTVKKAKTKNNQASETLSKKDPSLKRPSKNAKLMDFSLMSLMLCWVILSIFAAQFAVGIVMTAIMGEKLTDPVPTACYSALSYLLAMIMIVLIPPIVKAKIGKQNFSKDSINRTELGFRGWPTWTDIGLAPIGFGAYWLLASGLTLLFSTIFPWFNAGEAQEIGFSFQISGIDRLIAFLTLVVVAPIAEETIFRGWLYGKLRGKLLKYVPNGWSIIISTLLVSFLFGLVHLQWNVGVNVFAMSIVLCALREITGTIYADILLHMLKNGVAFFLLFILGIG
ncbi:CPBP family intramembrane metalloprotease [Candidatus Saccharibacteria bacterium]|nr:CPBP family intramembrane metalloprotease [Candidatus Saccharibacteria bacterium]